MEISKDPLTDGLRNLHQSQDSGKSSWRRQNKQDRRICLYPFYQHRPQIFYFHGTVYKHADDNGIKNRNYHKEYYKVAKKTYRQNDDKIKNREEIKHLSSGIDFKILDELDRALKKINIYIWCSKQQVEPLLKHYLDKNCNIEIITWHKDNVLPTANNTYLNDTEYCVFAREKGVKIYGEVKTKAKYYVTHTNTRDKAKYKHPTIKPLKIIKNFIINSSKENDIVLDCFSRKWNNMCSS